VLPQLVAGTDDERAALTDEEIADQSITVVLASFETTAGLLLVVLHCLAQAEHQHVVCKLHEEQAQAADTELSYQALQGMRYTCARELRGDEQHAVGGFLCSVTAPFKVEGVPIFPHHTFALDLVGAQSSLLADPETFRFERHLDSSDTNPLNLPYSFTPFGRGAMRWPRLRAARSGLGPARSVSLLRSARATCRLCLLDAAGLLCSFDIEHSAEAPKVAYTPILLRHSPELAPRFSPRGAAPDERATN
jgi:hypothetical protein